MSANDSATSQRTARELADDAPSDGRTRRFAVTTLALGAALVLATAGLAAVNVWQPPRVASVQEQPAQFSEKPGGRITLKLTQAVREVGAADVTVSPAVPLTVTSAGATLSVTLNERLTLASALRLRVSVTGVATGSTATIEHIVEVPDRQAFTLVRGNTAAGGLAGDTLVGNNLVGGGAPTEIRTQRQLREYALLPGRALAIIEAPGGGAGGHGVSLGEFAIPGGEYTEVIPQSTGQLSSLRTDQTGMFAGVLATGVSLTAFTGPRQLLLFDGRTGLAAPQPVLGPDGQPFAVADWRFIPGGVGVVVVTTAGKLWLATPGLGRDPVQLGAADRIVGFDSDSGELIAANGAALASYDVSAQVLGGEARAPRSLDAHFPGGSELEGVLAGGALVVRAPSNDLGTATLTVWQAGTIRSTFTPAGERSRIGTVCVAPSGTMIAAEVISAEGAPDGRVGRDGETSYSHVTTTYIEARTGQVLRSSIGAAPDWCGE